MHTLREISLLRYTKIKCIHTIMFLDRYYKISNDCDVVISFQASRNLCSNFLNRFSSTIFYCYDLCRYNYYYCALVSATLTLQFKNLRDGHNICFLSTAQDIGKPSLISKGKVAKGRCRLFLLHTLILVHFI